MIAHVLCPGPSLPRTWWRLGYGPVIAVNRAVDFTAADWLVAGDPITFTRITARPLSGVCSFNAVLRDQLPPSFAGLRQICWEDLGHPPGHQAQWGIEAALLLARHLAAGELLDIALFGCDQDPLRTDDWDGTAAADDRSADRWKREAADLRVTITYLESATRTRITRITP